MNVLVENEKNFLKEYYLACEKYYKEILNKNEKFAWDIIVITASNKEQAKSYEKQIQYRIKKQRLPENANIMVVPDPFDKRVGSGGATLNVLKILKENYSNPFDKKILLIHSGGDCKRVPQYSACGKLFSPIPKTLDDGKNSTLFDEIMTNMSMIPQHIQNGLFVLSGDVMMLFNPLQIVIDKSPAAAISIKTEAEKGEKHGVFCVDESNNLKLFLHKNSLEDLKKLGAIDSNNLVDIDTGCIFLSSTILEDLVELLYTNSKLDEKNFNKYINDKNRLSFYGDLIYPLATSSTIENYLDISSEGILDENLKDVRRNLWKILSKYNMKVIKTSPAKFIHTGTNREISNLFLNATTNFDFLNWNSNILSNKIFKDVSIINSYIDDCSNIGKGSFIENSYILNCKVGQNCIISNTKLNKDINDNTIVHKLPIKINGTIKYVTRIYGIDDNPKNAMYFKKKYSEIFPKNMFTDKTALWELDLFPICNTEEESIEHSLILQKIVNGTATEEEVSFWQSLERISLSKSFNLANIDEIVEKNEKLTNFILAHNVFKNYLNLTPIECVKTYLNDDNILPVYENIQKILCKTSYELYKKYALLSYLARISNKISDSEYVKYEDLCYKEIKDNIKKNNLQRYKGAYKVSERNIEISSPVRINFAGGWSDTPPYCHENGGTVLNAAITVNEKNPINIKIEKINEKKLILESIDLEKKEIINDFQIKNINFQDLNNPFILIKAALYVLGIETFDFMDNSGMKITVHVTIPKGSGLGTSSILAGTILKALSMFLNIKLTNAELFNYILCMEQLISTGGGWQDQIGGLTPSIKLIETTSGIVQKYKIRFIEENNNFKYLNNHLVLIYTGKRRRAKKILRKIMNSYIYNDINACNILKEIKEIANLMAFELEKGTIQNFCALMNKHFELIKMLDTGISTTYIEKILKESTPFLDAMHLVGAGGGGFIIGVLKSETSQHELDKHLKSIFYNKGVCTYSCSIVKEKQ